MRNYCGENNPNWNGGKTIRPDGYVHVLVDGYHHRKNDRGYVMEHIMVVESVIGKEFKHPNRIHHINGNRSDNRKENLVVCEDERYHQLLHTRTRALKESGNVNNRKCKFCKCYDIPENLSGYHNPKNGSDDYYHKKCASDRVLSRYHKKKIFLQEKNALRQGQIGQ
jgi:hypothetical protein